MCRAVDWPAEPWRHDADDFPRDGPNHQRSADSRWIGAEAAVPEAVADQHDPMIPLDFVLGREQAPKLWLHAQHGEDVGRRARAVDLFGWIAAQRERDRAFRHGRERLEHILPLPVVGRVGGVESRELGRSVPQIDTRDADEPVALVERQPAEDDGIDHREDGGGGAYPQREHHHDDGRESAAGGKAAKRMTEIAAQGIEPGPAVQRVELFELGPRIAEFDPRHAAGLFGRDAALDQIFRVEIEVGAHLVGTFPSAGVSRPEAAPHTICSLSFSRSLAASPEQPRG